MKAYRLKNMNNIMRALQNDNGPQHVFFFRYVDTKKTRSYFLITADEIPELAECECQVVELYIEPPDNLELPSVDD